MASRELPIKIYKALANALDLRRFVIESIYGGKSFRITGRGNTTNIYIRVENREDLVCVNFSSISIDEKLRRKGMLTSLVNHVASIPEVKLIVIGGVCTAEMMNWCYKNGYKLWYEFGYDYYKEV